VRLLQGGGLDPERKDRGFEPEIWGRGGKEDRHSGREVYGGKRTNSVEIRKNVLRKRLFPRRKKETGVLGTVFLERNPESKRERRGGGTYLCQHKGDFADVSKKKKKEEGDR